MERKRVKEAVELLKRLEAQEKEIKGLKASATRVLLNYFKYRRQRNPEFNAFRCGKYLVRLQIPQVDEFDAEGLYEALKAECQEIPPGLFTVCLRPDYLFKLLDQGKLDPQLVSKFWRIKTLRPYVRIYEGTSE